MSEGTPTGVSYWTGATLSVTLGFGTLVAIGLVAGAACDWRFHGGPMPSYWLATAVGGVIRLATRGRGRDVMHGVSAGILASSALLLVISMVGTLLWLTV